MFATLEPAHKLSKQDFASAELSLRQQLLTMQFELATKPYPVIIIVAGVSGAGRGAVLHRLNEWMDPRGIETYAFWDSSDEEEQRPYYWRFWRAMPRHGQIGVFFSSWYTQPILARACADIDQTRFDAELQRITEFERMLSKSGALVVKLWFHLSADVASKRLRQDRQSRAGQLHIPGQGHSRGELYRKFAQASERAIRHTDTRHSPWHLIDASKANYRDLTAGTILLRSVQDYFLKTAGGAPTQSPLQTSAAVPVGILHTLPKDVALSASRYQTELRKWQSQLRELSWQAREQKVSCVAVFEGWDAAGKGSALRRVTQAIDPRLFHLVQFAAPSDEERSHHYLWRFWRQLERDGKATFFDRSWYGRVLVERVEGFARVDEWQRAYTEINRFEEQLAEHGSVVLKFWLHISKEEQLARFEKRAATPHKLHKITAEDWRNRERWDEYELAVQDMITHTSTSYAPWTVIAGNNKRYARIQILQTYCERLEQALLARRD